MVLIGPQMRILMLEVTEKMIMQTTTVDIQ